MYRERTKHRRKEFPCVLCGAGTYDWDHVCNGCRQDHESGRRIREHEEKTNAAQKAEYIPILWYWWVGAGAKADRPKGDRSEITRRIRTAIIWLAGGMKTDRQYHPRTHKQIGRPYGTTYDSSFDIYRFPRRGTWKKLLELTEAIADLARWYYVDGHQNGRHLLAQIASGKLTIEEINKRMIGASLLEYALLLLLIAAVVLIVVAVFGDSVRNFYNVITDLLPF